MGDRLEPIRVRRADQGRLLDLRSSLSGRSTSHKTNGVVPHTYTCDRVAAG